MPEDDSIATVAGLRWTRWPTLPLPTEAQAVALALKGGPDAVPQFHEQREQTLAKEQHDPLQYGWESPPMRVMRALLDGSYLPGMVGTAAPAHAGVPMAHLANDVLALGGNGSGKTDALAKLGMETLVGKARREVRFWSQNERTSVRYQQPAIFRYMPPSLRAIKKQGQVTKISFNMATGFSEGIFVLPNQSVGQFLTYKGWEQDPKSAEGGEATRVVYDEEAPGELVETLRFRAHKTGGQVLGGFTPVGGYQDTVAQYLEGAEILETIPARREVCDWWRGTFTWGEPILPQDATLVPGCPPGHVPMVLRSAAGGGRRYVVVFPTPFNPYTNVDSIVAGALGRSREFSLERIYGWPTRRAARAFPKFGDVHLVDPDKVPSPRQMTVYQFCDPHGARNWFSLWLGVTAAGQVFAFKEWPPEEYGEWTLPGDKADGRVGPAQRHEGGKAFNDYKREFLEAEGWVRDERTGGAVAMVMPPGGAAITPWARFMDPRPAGTSVPSDEHSRTYLDYMSEPVLDSTGKVLVPGLDFLAADHCAVEDGTQLINNWLTEGWDDRRPVDPLNCPKFYVSRACPNLIYALRTWTGLDGEKGASKDPIDCLKGGAKMGLEHYEKEFRWSEGRGMR